MTLYAFIINLIYIYIHNIFTHFISIPILHWFCSPLLMNCCFFQIPTWIYLRNVKAFCVVSFGAESFAASVPDNQLHEFILWNSDFIRISRIGTQYMLICTIIGQRRWCLHDISTQAHSIYRLFTFLVSPLIIHHRLFILRKR